MYSGQNQERIGNGKPQNPRENKPHVIKLRGVKERKKKKKKSSSGTKGYRGETSTFDCESEKRNTEKKERTNPRGEAVIDDDDKNRNVDV